MKMDALIRKLKKCLQRAKDNANYLSELDKEVTWVDNTPDRGPAVELQTGTLSIVRGRHEAARGRSQTTAGKRRINRAGSDDTERGG